MVKLTITLDDWTLAELKQAYKNYFNQKFNPTKEEIAHFASRSFESIIIEYSNDKNTALEE